MLKCLRISIERAFEFVDLLIFFQILKNNKDL